VACVAADLYGVARVSGGGFCVGSCSFEHIRLNGGSCATVEKRYYSTKQ
jgi:hypothetical protein